MDRGKESPQRSTLKADAVGLSVLDICSIYVNKCKIDKRYGYRFLFRYINKKIINMMQLYKDFRHIAYRRLLLILLCICSYVHVEGGTIHWITFIDTNDKYVGDMDKIGRRVLHTRLIDNVNGSLSLVGYTSEVYDNFGSKVSPDNCIKIIEALKCDTSDIIVFYYIGHGFHSTNDKTNFPTLVLGDDTVSERSIPLSWVHNSLKSKGARFVISIGACSNVLMQDCNSNYETFSTQKDNHSDNSITFSKNELTSIQKAFLCTKGDIILSASSLGQASFGGPTSMGNMDLLTAALVTVFEDLTYENNFSWENLLEETSSIIKDVTDGKQIPLWHYNLRQSPIVE